MCDLLVALPDSTRNGKLIFGKNSDRPAGECQVLFYSPGGKGGTSKIQCSYIEVPGANRAMATLGCRPYWCWGYETGMNEAGVVGGNAAVFTRARRAALENSPGLTGMDLLRLALERGETAVQAVDVIIRFLEQYGQWGSAVAGKDHEAGGYDNSYLLADRKEAWVLETAARRWAAERVTSGVRTISNELTIRHRWTRASGDLQEFACSQGWHSGDGAMDYALAYSDHEHYARQVAHVRLMRSRDMLRQEQGNIQATTVMNVLRDHYEDTFLEGPQFHQFLPDFLTLCMHDSPAGFTWGNTATSVVVEVDPNGTSLPPYWLCYLPPCTGVYTAYFLGAALPETVTATGDQGLQVLKPTEAPKDSFRETSLWWRFQRIHDAVAQRPERHRELRAALDPIEAEHLFAAERVNLSRRDEAGRFIETEIAKVTAVLTDFEARWHLNL